MSSPELDGAIAGRVCIDADSDGFCSDGEAGVAGVRLILETGAVAVTDARGQYHVAGVGARGPDSEFLGGGRLLPGRHRLRLDDRGLPSGTRAEPSAVTVEVPMSSLVRQDFALAIDHEAHVDLTGTAEPQPRSTRIEQDGVRYMVTGRASPGDRVAIDGRPAEVDARGNYRMSVLLRAGGNDLKITANSVHGTQRAFIQRIDVVRRSGGALVVPRMIEPTASIELPAGLTEVASTGPTSLRLHSLPGTRVTYPGGEAVAGKDGIAQVPIELSSGDNSVHLRIERPGQPARDEALEIRATFRPFAVGLLNLEGTYDLNYKGVRLFGNGAAHAQIRVAGFELSGELDLRDQDLEDLKTMNRDPRLMLAVRRPDRLERALDPEEYPIEWADQSVTTATNPAEGRIRFEARSDTLGTVGFGTHRASFADSETGRYQRELFGPYVDLHTAASSNAQAGVRAFFDPALGDPTHSLGLVPAHEELRATGGSLYYLGGKAVSAGSEVVRVEVRDGLTALPIRELHLARGRDYEIDYKSGRILLSRPLSFVLGEGPLRAEPPTSNPEPVLVVDYERLNSGDEPGRPLDGRQVAGGEVWGSIGPARASVGALHEVGLTQFTLYRAQGSAALGPVTLLAEGALSEGAAFAPSEFGVSDDGGLTFTHATLDPASKSLGGASLGLRARGPGLSPEGYFDAAFRRRWPGFSDGAHEDVVGLRQYSLRVEQPVGDFRVGVLADNRYGADPRQPFGPVPAASQTLAGSVGWHKPNYGVTLEARDSLVTASTDLSSEALAGGRTSVGLSGRYRVNDRITVTAGHKQVLAHWGAGLGAFDDSFSSVGADVKLDKDATVGLLGGWGPRLGPQVWGHADAKSGRDTYYGGYSVDVDGPHLGEGRAVTGARTEAGDGAVVFVEDVATHDANLLRMSRAVGLSQSLGSNLELTGRYERGARELLGQSPGLVRDMAGATASWVHERVRAYGRAEVRFDRGVEELGAPVAVSRTQRLVGAGCEAELATNLHASARATFSDTTNEGKLEARLLEGAAGLAWRIENWMVVLRYSIEREFEPLLPRDTGLQIISFMPAVHIGSRLTVAGGAYLGISSTPGSESLTVSGSLRPSVRVLGDLEVGAEVARRSRAADGGDLSAVRGEAGYRVSDSMLVAVGYTAYGYSGMGLSTHDTDSRDRFYVRAEMAY